MFYKQTNLADAYQLGRFQKLHDRDIMVNFKHELPKHLVRQTSVSKKLFLYCHLNEPNNLIPGVFEQILVSPYHIKLSFS